MFLTFAKVNKGNKDLQRQGATVVCVIRQNIQPGVTVVVSCASSAVFMCFCATSLSGKGNTPRGDTLWAKLRCSTLLRRTECTLYPLRCNVVAARAGGGTLCSLALQRNEARALRKHGDGLQLLWRAGFGGKNVASWTNRSRVLSEVHRPLRRSCGKSRY